MNSKSTEKIETIAQDIIDDFALFDSWEDRYSYVIEYGKKIPPFNETFRSNEYKVHGCTSQVWLYATPNPNHPDCLTFYGDSDAHIVKGLLAILLTLFSNHTKEAILQYDISHFLNQIHLQDHLSPNRANGFFAMVKRFKELAAKA